MYTYDSPTKKMQALVYHIAVFILVAQSGKSQKLNTILIKYYLMGDY